MIANFAALDVRRVLIEQRDEHANQPSLGLASQPQQNEVVPRKHGIYNLRNYGIFVSDDSAKQRVLALELRDQIRAKLILYSTVRELFCKILVSPKSADRLRKDIVGRHEAGNLLL